MFQKIVSHLFRRLEKYSSLKCDTVSGQLENFALWLLSQIRNQASVGSLPAAL